MTRIESLTLHGFKSFGEKVRLEFGPGITAVVGPNGSGKSNVVEALRWVTHGARARALRAASATDLIFHGAEGKASVGLAEVQLELRGNASLSRRLYRDGEGEQDLAGRRVRVREVLEALRGTGLGLGSLSIVGQGEVSSVVGADPRTLLEHLEEAAGLGRLAAQRSQTLERLAEAGRSLETLRPLRSEREGTLERLRGEAGRFREHQGLSARRRLLEQALAHSRVQALLEDIAALRHKAQQLEEVSGTRRAELEAGQAQLEAARRSWSAAQRELAGYERARERHSGLEREVGSATLALGHLEQDLGRTAAERQTLADLTLPERPDLDAPSSTLEVQRGHLKALERRLRERETELGTLRKAQLTQERQSARLELLEAEQARLEAERHLAAAAVAQAEQALTEFRPGAGAEPQALRDALSGQRARLNDLRLAQGRLESELAALERERSRLDRLLSSHARYGEGPRNALSSGLPGILGSVADLLTVPLEYETALSSALGRRLEQVVVQSGDTARACIAHLKRVGGRATFLPLDLLRPRTRREGGFAREAGVVGWACDLCPSDPPQVAESLLGDTLIVESDVVAVRLARTYPNRPRLVSLDGELLEPGGALTGGRAQDSGVSHLSDLRRLEELNAEAGGLLERRQTLEREAALLGTALPALERELSTLEATRSDEARQRATLERGFEQKKHALEGVERQLQRLRSDPAASPVPLSADPAALEAELDTLRGQLEAGRALEREMQASFEAARRGQLAYQHAQEALARRGRLDEALFALEGRFSEAQARVSTLNAQLEAARAELETLRPPELAALEGQVTALEREQARRTTLLSTTRGDLEMARVTLARREAALGDTPPAEPVDLPGTPRSWSAESAELERRLGALGAVNPLAPEQLEEEEARTASLERELTDAEGAVLELRGVLELLEGDLERGRGQALERVRLAFTQYSGELLGGMGEIVSERGPGGTLSGLTLSVQPAGKRTRALNLLSTGERTLVGLAFLFALSSAPEDGLGLPLAVLDEVDAPLDEANIRRFAHFLKLHAARGTQFILVTHQKATMEVADYLWGVTTQRGVSRTFSIRALEEVG